MALSSKSEITNKNFCSLKNIQVIPSNLYYVMPNVVMLNAKESELDMVKQGLEISTWC